MFARHALSLGLATLTLAVAPKAEAQRVSADIFIGGYPVSGAIRIGDRPYYRYGYPRPRAHRSPYIVYPSRVVVERRHGWNWKKHRNARLAVVYYDRQCDLYFDRYRRGLEEIRVLYDDNRYYWYDDYDGRYDDRFGYDRRGRDRDRDWDRDRYDDRRHRDNDRYDRREDRDDRYDDDNGRWEHDH